MVVDGDDKKRSRARVETIPRFSLKETKTMKGKVVFEESQSFGSGYYPNFPIIIQSNSVPWRLGNLVLLKKLQETYSYKSRTFTGYANHLLDYLRWLEEHNVDPLKFPKLKHRRPTYRYRKHLIQRIQDGNLGDKTGSARINAVIQFYRELVAYELVDQDPTSLAFEDISRLKKTTDKHGIARTLKIKSTDLFIETKPRSNTDAINDDGESLTPLSKDQQTTLLTVLRNASIAMQLIFFLPLLTGARMQTVLTLRVKDIRGKKAQNDGYYRMKCGPRYGIDTKHGKNITLFIPERLLTQMQIYAESPMAIKRRKKSHYGDVEDNYLFLTRNGTPYYTSTREIRERADEGMDSSVVFTERTAATIKEGQAVRSYLTNTLMPKVRAINPDFPDFSPHDLRATFGMNLLEGLLDFIDRKNSEAADKGLANVLGTDFALQEVKKYMCHEDIRTTLRYLNYRTTKDYRAQIQSEVEAEILSFISESEASLEMHAHNVSALIEKGKR